MTRKTVRTVYKQIRADRWVCIREGPQEKRTGDIKIFQNEKNINKFLQGYTTSVMIA